MSEIKRDNADSRRNSYYNNYSNAPMTVDYQTEDDVIRGAAMRKVFFDRLSYQINFIGRFKWAARLPVRPVRAVD